MLSYFHDGRCHVQTCTHTNRLLVAHDAGATAVCDPFDWPTPSTLERLAYRATSTTFRVAALRTVLFLPKRMASSRRCPHLLLASLIRPSGSYLAYGARPQRERPSTTFQGIALGVVPFFALCTAIPRRCSRSFLTGLDLLDRVVATLLGEFQLPFGSLHLGTCLLLGSRKPGSPFSGDTKT
jgi:hypothetical protein